MAIPERFSNLPDYAFPRLRKLLDPHPAGGDPVNMTIGEPQLAPRAQVHPSKSLRTRIGDTLQGLLGLHVGQRKPSRCQFRTTDPPEGSISHPHRRATGTAPKGHARAQVQSGRGGVSTCACRCPI